MFENNTFNMFFTYMIEQQILLGRPALREKINEFNRSYRTITKENYKNVIDNMRHILNDCSFTNNETGITTTFSLGKIDEPIHRNIN